MKNLFWLTVPLAVFASVLAGPIPEHHQEGIFVTKVNNSADPVPQHPQPEASSSSSSKPDILKDDPLLVKDEDPIDGKIDNIPPSTESNVDGHAALLESSTANLDLNQRAAEESSSSQPAAGGADEDLGKSLEQSSSAAPEVPREERIETNVVLADDDGNNVNSNASELEEGGRSEQQLSTQNPSNEENIDARSQQEKASEAPVMWNEDLQSSPAPASEKIERKEDLQEGASSAAPLQLVIELRHAEEPQSSSQSPLIDEKIELSAASSEPSALDEKSVEDNKNLTLLDEPKKEEEKLDITVLKGGKLREKRETIEILLEKEVNPATSEPQPSNEAENNEKPAEKLAPEAELHEKLHVLDEPQEIQPSSQAPIDDLPIAETLSKGTEEKLTLPLADEPQQESSSSSKPSLQN